jgi:hypothetical protein
MIWYVNSGKGRIGRVVRTPERQERTAEWPAFGSPRDHDELQPPGTTNSKAV